MLTFTVDKQILKRTDTDKAIADSVKYLTATFTFSEDWTGTTKTVLFNHETVTYAMILESDTCVVPWEVIHSDYFRVSAYGVKDDERITTNNVTVYVGESGYTEGGEPQPPTPSQIEQILQILSNLTGGAANKVLAKKSSQDYDFTWVNNEGGGGGGSSVEWDQIVKDGLKIAKITIGDEPINVYIPTPFSGDYEDLANQPTIPTKTSDLTNDSGFLTSHQSIKTLNKETLVGTGDVSTHQSETITVSGDTVSKQLTPHKLCYFDGTLIALTITFPQTVSIGDEFNFIFRTSANGCTLTVPSSVKWDGGEAPTLEANTIYEVSIDGLGIALISQGVSAI